MAIFNLIVSILTLVIMIVFKNYLQMSLFYLLTSQPLSILVVFYFIFLRRYNELDLKFKSYPWHVVCNISLPEYISL